MKRVLIVGSAEQSGGGVSSVIRTIKTTHLWNEFSCYWLGTQIQRNYLWKLWYAVKGNVIALFIMWRYDIVHMHTTPDKLGLLIQLPILLWAKMLGKKVIIQLHVGNQLKTKKNGLFVFTLKRADLIILLAKKWQKFFEEYYPEIKVKTTVLYNAIQEVPLRNSEKSRIILYAGYFDENKAPDVLLKALHKISSSEQRNCLDGWKVIMMGNGNVEKYKSLSHELGLDNIVSFPGYVTGAIKENIWNKASIICLCSYEEGFPMVVLEAWEYGVAVITTPVGGLPDVIEEGRNCVTFGFGDSEGLAKQLQCLIADDEKRHMMANYSRQFVEKKFSIENMECELRKIYSC